MTEPATNSIPQPGVEKVTRDSHYNDTSNAEALIDAHGHEIAYVPGWGWLAFDGARWVRDAEHLVTEHAKQTIKTMFWRAAPLDDTYERQRLLRHANASLSHPRLQAMLNVAKTDPRIRSKVEDFDADSMLFNCANGTIDLRDGMLHAHDAGDHITMLSPVEYDPSATSELLEDFIHFVSDGRDDLASYLQQAMGYSLTGETGEKGFFFAFGATGNNGKSTLLEAVLHVMGDYGAAVSPQVILSKNGISGDSERDATQLVGKRYVITSEPESGQQFRMGHIKRLTGGDTMTARHLYEKPFQFRPRLKLWFAANQRPAVPENNDAAWNRIKFVPFDARVVGVNVDPQLGAKLRQAAPAILAWMVQGCLAWQTNDGLHEPACMREATKDYRADQDSFQAFLDECCEASPNALTPLKEILDRYGSWQRTDPDAPELGRKALSTSMEAHGYRKKRASSGMAFVGVVLREPEVAPRPTQERRWESSCQQTTYRPAVNIDADEEDYEELPW